MRGVTERPGRMRRRSQPAFLVLSLLSLVLVFEPALQGSTALAGADPVVNLIGNGSFESVTPAVAANSFRTIEAGDSTSIAPWTVDPSTPAWSVVGTGNASSIDVVDNGYFQAEDGSNSVDLEGTPGPGAVSQTIDDTVAGTEYSLSWWMAGNPSCSTTPVTYQMDVYWNGSLVADPTFLTQTTTNMGWVEKDVTVTGTGDPVEVQFATPSPTQATELSCGATLDNVSLSAISGTVEASLSSTTSTVPGVETVPVSAIDGSTGSGSSGSSGDTSSAPLSSIPLSSIPLSSIDLAASPLASIPLSSIPLSSIALPAAGDTAIAAAQEALSSTILADVQISFPQGCGVSGGPSCTGWTGVLAGSPLVGLPLEAVTLADVLENPTAAANFNSVDLGALDLSSTPMSSIPMSSIELGATPLSSIDIDGATSTTTALAAWCSQLSTLGFDCSADFGIDASTGADNGVTLFSLALAGVPLSSTPLSSIPLSSISLSSSPLSSIPLSSISLSSSPLSSIPLSSIALLSSVVNCSTFTCSGATLGEASLAGAVLPGATLGDVLNGDDASVPGYPALTFGDLLLATIPPASYPWSALSLSDLPLAANGSGGGTVSYTGTLTVTGATSTVTVDAVLPPTFAYVPGSSTLDGASTPDPSGTSTLVWTFTLAVGVHTLDFQVNAGIGLGPATATLSASVDAGGDPSSSTTVDVVDGEEPTIETPGTAMPLVPGTPPTSSGNLNLGYLTSPGDLNDWSVTVPNNEELSVALTNLPATYDLELFGPGGQQLQGTPTQDLGGVTDAPPSLNSGGTTEATPGSQDLPVTPPAGDVLEAVANNPDGQSQYIQTPPLTGGTYIVQVSGYNGASSSQPYLLQANLLGGATNPSCTGSIGFVSSLPAAASGPVTIPSNANTLFLLDTQRLSASYGASAAAQIATDVNAVASDSAAGVVGAVVPVDSFASVQAAYASWNANPCSVEAANGVVSAVSAVVDEIRAAHPSVQNLVIVGPDDQIPFARIADGATESNERDYGASTFAGENNVEADALSLGYYFSDDPFAASQPLGVGSATLYLPQLAVGRLVESASEIESSLTRFVSSGGNLNATASLTTGYSFLTSGAEAVSANLAANGLAPSTLINESWAASDLDQALAASPTPVVDSINAHFDYSRALPADDNAGASTPLVTTADVSDPPDATSYAGRLLFSMGCHAGLDIDDAEVASSGVATPVQDWAKTFADVGALWVANTGYGYADTDTIAYSAKLMADFAGDLNGSVTIGAALAEAKQAYAADDALPSPYDLKALMESTFYGLPMYTLNKPPTPVAPPTGPSTVVVDPSTGLSEFSTAISFNLGSGNSTAAGKLGLVDTANGDYYQVNGTTASNAGTLTTEFRPIEPLISDTVTEPGLSPHGELVTALSSTDVADPTPAYSLPSAGSANSTPPAIGSAAFPGTLGRVATYGTFTPSGTGQGAELDLAAGQFLPSQSTPGAGTERLFNTLSAQVFFLSPTSPYANDYTPPTIDSTTTSASGPNALFNVQVTPAGAPVTQVLVLYTDAANPGTWTATDLSSSDGLNWSGSGALPPSGQVQYMVQVVDGAGNVAFSNNEGTAFNSNVLPAPISISLAGTGPIDGAYTSAVTATISAPSGSTYSLDGSSAAAVPANSQLVVSGDGQHTLSVTDPANATVTQDFVISDDQTSTSIGANHNPAVEGQPVTLSANVSALSQGAPNPSGNVEFLDGSTPIAGCGGSAGVPLSGDTATCSVSYTSPGQKQLIASYLGDGTLSSSTSSPLSLGVNARTASITTFSAAGTPVAYGNEQSLVFSATVTAGDADAMPTGDTVTLSDGAIPVCVVPLTPGASNSASGTCSPTSATALPVGPDNITAVFNASGADTTFAAVAPVVTPVSVGQATPTINWATPAAITFGTALSTSQLDATSPQAGTFAYTPPITTVLSPGTQKLSVTFTPMNSTDYVVATDSVNLVVNKVAPIITWATPKAITYGTALSKTQLDAAASVPGTFVYSPLAGSFPMAGNDTLSVTFTPTNSTDDATVTFSVPLVVHPATLLVLASTTSMTYGQTPPSIGASYVGFVAGDSKSSLSTQPTCTSGATASSNVGAYLTLCAGAVDSNYAITYVPGVILVLPATPTVTWAAPASIKSGTALSKTQLDATASVAGTFSYSPAAGTVLSVGAHTLTVKFTPTSTNYSSVSRSVSITVTKA